MTFSIPGYQSTNPSEVGKAIANIANTNANTFQLVPAQAEQAQSAAELNKAQAEIGIPAEAALKTAQTQTAQIANQNAQIDLSNRVKMIQAMRETANQSLGGGQPGGTAPVASNPQSSPTPAQSNNETTQSSPVASPSASPGTPLPPVGQAQPSSVAVASNNNPSLATTPPAGFDKTSPTHVVSYMATNNTASQGIPPTLTDDYIQSTAQKMTAAGVEPMAVNKYIADSTVARVDLAKKVAETAASTANANLSATEQAIKGRDLANNVAYDTLLQYQSDPNGATAKAATVLHLDLTTPDGLAKLTNMANVAGNNLTVQEQQNRNAQVRIDQQNANTRMGELAVSQGRLDKDKAETSLQSSSKAAQTATLYDNIVDTQLGMLTLRNEIANGNLTPTQNGMFVGSVNQMEPGNTQVLLKALGAKVEANGQVLVTQAQMDALAGRAVESAMSAQSIFGKGVSTASDARMAMFGRSVEGSGFSVSNTRDVNLTNLDNAYGYLGNLGRSIRIENQNANEAMKINGGDNFTPIETKMVPVFNLDGKPGYIPRSQLPQALQLGYTTQ